MNHPRQLVGSRHPALTPVGRTQGTSGRERMFASARFALAPDGRALFVPASAHVADDLWPLVGAWTPDGDVIEVNLRRVVSEHRHAVLTGRIRCPGEQGSFTGRYELRVGDEVHTHAVVVELDGRPAAVAGAGVQEIGGVPLPVRMNGTMSGSCAGQPFGPSDLTLSLLEPVAGAAEPVELLLASTEYCVAGGLSWLTGTQGLDEEQTGRYQVTAWDGRIIASMTADTDAAAGISFDAPSGTPLQIPGIGALFLPVNARRARLELRITRIGTTVRVDGALQLSGHPLSGPVTLDATLTAHGSLPAATDLDGPGFEQLWATGALRSPEPCASVIRSWRDARDEGFALARARRYREAAARLTEAITGCRAEQASASEQARTNALISEANMLGVLIPCYGPGTSLEVLLELLIHSVGLQERLGGIEHLTEMVRHGAHSSMVTLSDAIEHRRGALETELERVELLTESAGFFGRLVGLLLRLDQPEAALVASERARARALADLLVGRDSDQPLYTTEALTKAKIRVAVTDYTATVVEYWLDDAAGHAWVVQPDGRIGYVPLALGAIRLNELVGSLRDESELVPDVLAELYRLLIASLPAELLPRDGAPLAIVPHGQLFTIPFAALTAPDGTPLVQRWPLVMLPSIGTIVAAGLGGPATPVSSLPRVFAIADPTMPATPAPQPALLALPRVRAGVATLTGLFPEPGRTVHTGAAATLAALGRDVLGADLLLLGTHGYTDDDLPENSYLALAPDPGRHSGLARISELARLRLNARLAMLLACSTAAGKITGDGVLGISRAFLLGGARSLICPLRPVGDRAAIQLADFLLTAWLRDGVSVAEALRLAQLRLRAYYGGQPHLWADFVLIGAWR
jgi:CHAT domain-containing protein